MDIGWFIYKYQILIAGIVGFAGVIFTLWHNAKLAREQRIEEAKDARAQREEEREHEREALRAALVAELKINRDAIENNLKKREEAEDGDVEGTSGAYVPTDSLTETYQSFLPRIGLLSEHEVNKVMWAYLSLQHFNATLYLIGVPPHTTDRHVYVQEQNLGMLVTMQEQMLEPIDEALATLQSTGGRNHRNSS